MSKKKFSETKVGKFLSQAAPNILGVAGDILPDAGVLGMVKNLIQKDDVLPPEDKEKALKLLDSFEIDFHVAEGWVSLLQTLLVTVYVAYFGSRGAEKFQSIKNK